MLGHKIEVISFPGRKSIQLCQKMSKQSVMLNNIKLTVSNWITQQCGFPHVQSVLVIILYLNIGAPSQATAFECRFKNRATVFEP